MVPLDVTHCMLTTRERIERFRKLGNRTGVATAEMLDFFERFDVKKYGWDGGPLHDPCVIAYLLKPELFEGRHCQCRDRDRRRADPRHDRGRLLGRHRSAPRTPIICARAMPTGFTTLLFERLATLA